MLYVKGPRDGMSRVELLVAGGLLLLLGTLMILAVLDAGRRARDADVVSRVRQVQAEIERYRGRTASYPAALDDLQPPSEGFEYAPEPEGCRADSERLCTGYALRFVMEGRMGSLEGGNCVADGRSVSCARPGR